MSFVTKFSINFLDLCIFFLVSDLQCGHKCDTKVSPG